MTSTKATVSSAMRPRRMASIRNGKSAQAKPSGQRICRAMGAAKVKIAAAMSDASSLRPSSRANRNVPRAAMKNAIDAVKVKLVAVGRISAIQVKGL